MSTQQSSQSSASEGKRIALVVGNNGQSGQGALKYATKSAQAVADTLHSHCGFEVLNGALLGEQAITNAVKNAIYELVEERNPNDFLLFYFCGHGEPLFVNAEQRDIYLVTKDFTPKRVKTDKNAHISFSWLRDQLYDSTNAGTVLIVLDCCYAGNAGYLQEEQPLETLKQSIEQCFTSYLGSKQEQRKGVRVTLAATTYNETIFEENGLSVFSFHLLPVLSNEDVGSPILMGKSPLTDSLRIYVKKCRRESASPINL